MKKKFLALAMLFTIFFALSCLSVLAEEPAVIYPDSQSGAYSCTYDSAQPGRTYLVTVVKGLYDNAAIPDIEDADIVYFNSFTADNDGRVEITYVPSSYADSTVIISSGHLSAPEVVCHAKAGEAIDVVDFEIVLAKDTYTVSGNGYPVYVRYSINAVDSFGFPTTLPADAVRSFDNYEGDRMRFLENANTIELSDNLEPGQYTFSISCGGITEKATFTVERDPSVVSELDLKVNGEKNSAYYVECFNGIGETTFDPEYLLFEANVLDQYGDIMSDTYTYEYAEIDSNGIPGPVQKLDASSSSYKLYPLGTAGPLDILEYVVYVTSNTYPSLKEQVRVTIVGRSEYEGAADSLYLEYINAQMYVLKMQNGEIVIDVSSDNVPASKQWITQALADSLAAQTTSAKQLLEQHEQTPVADNVLRDAEDSLNTALRNFERALKKGTYALIEKIQFEIDEVELAVGRSTTISAVLTPTRPSEKVQYSSSNPNIAKVNAQTGYVTALAPGQTIITASNTDGSINSFYTLNVYRPVTSIKFDKRSYTVVAGTSFVPECTVLPSDHTDTITLSSSDPDVVRINGDSVEAVGKGTATVTAASKSGITASFTVSVKQPDFSATENIRSKPGSKAMFAAYVYDGEEIASLTLRVSFDTEFLTFATPVQGDFEDSYITTQEISDGVFETTWNFEENGGAVPDGRLLTYVFDVSESAPLVNYPFELEFIAKTADGHEIKPKTGNCNVILTIGTSDTYKVFVTIPSGGIVSGEGDYTFGETVTLLAHPYTGYTFTGWYLDKELLESDDEYTFEVTSDINITAKFTKSSTGSGGGGGGGGGGGLGGGITQLPKAATVTANVPSGIVAPGTKVTLDCGTLGAIIYYTLDGTVPSASTGIRYTTPIEITENGTVLRAVAVKSGMTQSDVAGFTYRFAEDTQEGGDEGEGTQGAVIALKANAAQIKYLTSDGVSVRPDDTAARYEVIEMLSKLFDVSGVQPKDGFPDLDDAHRETVQLYAAAGIINGYPDGTFGGALGITRAELVKILSVMLGVASEDIPEAQNVTLSDISGHWAEDYIKKFVAKGYILGYPEGDFRPDQFVTRAEVVTILNRITGITKVTGLPARFSDLTPEFWGYDEIMNVVE